MKGLHWFALLLVVIGAINWGLIGFFAFDLVAWLFGGQLEPASRVVYALVGIAGLVVLFTNTALMGRTTTDRYDTRRDRVTTTTPPPAARTTHTR